MLERCSLILGTKCLFVKPSTFGCYRTFKGIDNICFNLVMGDHVTDRMILLIMILHSWTDLFTVEFPYTVIKNVTRITVMVKNFFNWKTSAWNMDQFLSIPYALLALI